MSARECVRAELILREITQGVLVWVNTTSRSFQHPWLSLPCFACLLSPLGRGGHIEASHAQFPQENKQIPLHRQEKGRVSPKEAFCVGSVMKGSPEGCVPAGHVPDLVTCRRRAAPCISPTALSWHCTVGEAAGLNSGFCIFFTMHVLS